MRFKSNFVRRSKRERHIKALKKYFYFGVVAVFILGAVFFALTRSYLQVAGIAIYGADMADINRISKETRKFLSAGSAIIPKSNILFLPRESLQLHLENEFLEIEKIDASLNYIDKQLKLNIAEREIWAILCAEFQCFYSDNSGLLFKKVDGLEKLSVLKIEDKREDKPFLGYKFLDGKQIDHIDRFLSILKTNGYDPSGRIEIRDNGMYKIYLQQKTSVVLDFDTDINTALSNLKTVMENVKEDQIEHLDLRFEDKVFYK